MGTISKGCLNWILHDFTFKFEYLMVRKITLGVPLPQLLCMKRPKSLICLSSDGLGFWHPMIPVLQFSMWNCFLFGSKCLFFVAKTLYSQYIYVLFQNPRLLDNHTIKPHRRTKKWDPWILDPEEHFSKALNWGTF